MPTIHHSRLTWWAHRAHGMLDHDGVSVELHQRPPILAGIRDLAELVYTSDGPRYVQDATQARRDLLPAESAEIMRYVRQVALDARHAAGRPVRGQ